MTGLRLTAEYLGSRPQRPPRAELHVNVHLENTEDETRWVLVPDTLATPPHSPDTQVLSLAGWLLGEQCTIHVLHATSDAGWFAVLLPPGATVSVVDLPLSWWGEIPASVELVAHYVTDLRVNGEPITGQLGIPEIPLADRLGDAGAVADPSAVVAALEGTPHDPLPVSWKSFSTTAARLQTPAVE